MSEQLKKALAAAYREYQDARAVHASVRSAYIEDRNDPERAEALDRSSNRLHEAKRAVAVAVNEMRPLTREQLVRMTIGPDLKPDERALVESLVA